MTVVFVCLIGWALGRPVLELGALAAMWVAPIPAAAALLLVGARRPPERPRRPEPVMLLVRLAAELRSGSTLRGALVGVLGPATGHDQAVRLAASGRPLAEVAQALELSFGAYGRITSAAVRLSGSVGGSVAPVFEQLAAHVVSLDELARERRAAAAPGLLQAGLVGGVPAAGLMGMLASGRWIELASSGGASTVVVVGGSVLVLAGIGWVAAIVRRAGR